MEKGYGYHSGSGKEEKDKYARIQETRNKFMSSGKEGKR